MSTPENVEKEHIKVVRPREGEPEKECKIPIVTCQTCGKAHKLNHFGKDGYTRCDRCCVRTCSTCIKVCICTKKICVKCCESEIHKNHCKIWEYENILRELKEACPCNLRQKICDDDCAEDDKCYQCYPDE